MQKTERLKRSVLLMFYDFHGLSAAPGDGVAGRTVEYFMADGAVDVAFLFRFRQRKQAAFQFCFHSLSFLRIDAIEKAGKDFPSLLHFIYICAGFGIFSYLK